MSTFWNERYSQAEYVYGEDANDYLKQRLENLPKGKILFPADGEGRNSVYAASLGWDVFCFDQSIAGKTKALELAAKKGVSIKYQVGELGEIEYPQNEFDVIALIYAHFEADKKSDYHQKLIQYLKPGGYLIFEAFCKNHLPYRQKNAQVGGPDNIDMLFSIEEIQHDFKGFEILELEETEIELNEGKHHLGRGKVIRFFSIKK